MYRIYEAERRAKYATQTHQNQDWTKVERTSADMLHDLYAKQEARYKELRNRSKASQKE